ncbi:MAG: hypothetical protein Q8N98_05230, partial [bacterium]|nr:hypothetical protein [bacterium]
LTLVKNYQAPGSLTMQDAFKITNTASVSTTWQLKNNQDATFIPINAQNAKPTPIPAQGFGFYESSGGLGPKQTTTIRAYTNNNRQAGIYQGSYTLQQVVGSRTLYVEKISYRLTVLEPSFATPAPLPTCGRPCGNNSQCGTGLVCGSRPCLPGSKSCIQVLVCLNPQCPLALDCRCSSPTPTPIPAPNNPPRITTTGLPSGRVNQYYSANISATDPDKTDTVSITISNLPSGLSQGPCSRGFSTPNTTTCSITGAPRQGGTFRVNILAQDNRGGKTNQVISLIISNAKIFPWLPF